MNLRCLKLYRAYSIFFNSSNVGNFFDVKFYRTASKFRKRKRKLSSFVPVLDKTWNQAVSRCSRVTTAEKCTKKCDACAKLLFCLSKRIAFLPFLLSSPSSLRKLPNIQPLFNSISKNNFWLFTDSPPVPLSERRQTHLSYKQNGFPFCYRNKQKNFTNNQTSCSLNTQRRCRNSISKF